MMMSLSGRLYRPDLWVLVNLLGVLLITVDVESDRSSGAACAAETENNSGTIGKDDPEALREKTRKDEEKHSLASETWSGTKLYGTGVS